MHVYLSEVEEDGTVRYVTEGVLRAIHRKESEPEPAQRWSWPFRTFARADAGADAEGRAAAPALRAAADLLGLQARQPHPALRSPARMPTTTPRSRMGARRC